MSKELRHALGKDIFDSGLVKNDDCEDLAGYLIKKGWRKSTLGGFSESPQPIKIAQNVSLPQTIAPETIIQSISENTRRYLA